MSCLAVSDNCFVVARGLHISYHNVENVEHTTVKIDSTQENDLISDVTISPDGKYLALITSTSKQLLLYELPTTERFKKFTLPRSASKIRFTASCNEIIVADKSGDALLYEIEEEDSGTKLLGHLSLLLDILQTSDRKFIITSDRDEKIRVSCYPNTYNIQTYCLGHREFVNHIELLPHNKQYLTSTSGDGFVKCWDYITGKICYSIDTYLDVNDDELRENFANFMNSDGVQVTTLPIVHYSMTCLDENSSILAVLVHTYNKILLYKLQSENNVFKHELLDKLSVNHFPAAIQFHKTSLYCYDDENCYVSIFNIAKHDSKVMLELYKKVNIFENCTKSVEIKEGVHESIKVLFKRKFDNVQEYQERKKQRLGKSLQ